MGFPSPSPLEPLRPRRRHLCSAFPDEGFAAVLPGAAGTASAQAASPWSFSQKEFEAIGPDLTGQLDYLLEVGRPE